MPAANESHNQRAEVARLLAQFRPDDKDDRIAQGSPATAITPQTSASTDKDDIAIIGMAGRFPGSPNLARFWENLQAGNHLIQRIPQARWDGQKQARRQNEHPTDAQTSLYHAGLIDDVLGFDAKLFGISPREVEAMDPHQRVLLEVVWATLEHAGYAPSALSGTNTGVFIAMYNTDFAVESQLQEWDMATQPYLTTGSGMLVSNRISYIFNLQGPSEIVATACSSALVALHKARQAIQSGDCTTAVVGGVSLLLSPERLESLGRLGILSTAGYCAPFDQHSPGEVLGEGAGAVLLKPLKQAQHDGDTIHAILKTTGTNHHGNASGSLTMPSLHAQRDLIIESYRRAQIDPRTIGLIEAHGSGNVSGDKIELLAFHQAYTALAREQQVVLTQQHCGIGSLKGNTGFLEAAGGMAQLFKVILAMQHGTLPATLNFQRADESLQLETSPFYIIDRTQPWQPYQDDTGRTLPRRGALNAYGLGGTNAHVVVETYCDGEDGSRELGVGRQKTGDGRRETEDGRRHLVVLSAQHGEQLRAVVSNLYEYLCHQPAQTVHNLEAIAYTLQVGREAMANRLAFVVTDIDQLCNTLSAYLAGDEETVQLYRGQVKKSTTKGDAIDENVALEEALRGWQNSGEWTQLAQLWVTGIAVDWYQFYRQHRPRRVPLPTYPFAREVVDSRNGAEGASVISAHRKPNSDATGQLVEKIQADLTHILSVLLKVGIDEITGDTHLSDLGATSITFVALTKQLNERYQLHLMPTLFFEQDTLMALSRYLAEQYPVEMQAFYQVDVVEEQVRGGAERHGGITTQSVVTSKTHANDAIAVVGMSGIMPGSPDLETFWHHLEQGHDLITEIPPERWDWCEMYDATGEDPQKSWSKWGGFIPDAAAFDPLFFNISPHEAEMMDPQHRLFLQAVWHCIEDAGYRASALAGRAVGVYVGVQFQEYNELLSRALGETNAQMITGNSHAMVANRISFLLDLRGPSEAIDTACSSSLVALHRAAQAMRSGEIESALVGGVSLALSPATFVGTSQTGVLAPDGRCKTFDKAANGFVKGEGVGVILLKPLPQAEQDGDHIYAIVRGSAENHGGRATSLTAPNPQAQADLLINAYRQAGIDPTTVSYIEAHGTGTALGDPIEINGLKQAFATLYAQAGQSPPLEPHCGLGSVKSNIGHLETAAGIAGVIKILLAMKHQTLPATIHFREQNPYIDLTDSPFYLVTKTQTWQPLLDEAGEPIPRRAGVSSFGFGGSNAHVVLEEWRSENGRQKTEDGRQKTGDSYVIVLSARDAERLKVYASKLLDYLENLSAPVPTLESIAYTLQVGREAMENRLAMVVKDVATLCAKLTAYLDDIDEIEQLYRGDAAQLEQRIGVFADDEDLQATIQRWLYKGKLAKLAELWVAGVEIAWDLLYGDQPPRRVVLPTYPFACERYWIPEPSKTRIDDEPARFGQLHPLIHHNISDLAEQCFSSTFTGAEFFLRDHQMRGERVLPAAAQLEMALAAGTLALRDQAITAIKDVAWMQPLIVAERPVAVQIGLYPDENATIRFEISSHQATQVVHSQGTLVVGESTAPAWLEIAAIEARCQVTIASSECYPYFNEQGMIYGPTFQGLDEIRYNAEEALAHWRLPSIVEHNSGDINYHLHPAIVDAALQATVGLHWTSRMERGLYLPFTMQTFAIYRELPEQGYVYVQPSASLTDQQSHGATMYDITVTDTQGAICVVLREVMMRKVNRAVLDAAPLTDPMQTATEIGYYTTKWQVTPLPEHGQTISGAPAATTLLLIGLDAEVIDTIAATYHEAEVVTLPTDGEDDAATATALVQTVCTQLQTRMKCRATREGHCILVVAGASVARHCFAPLAALLKTARWEEPRFQGKVLSVADQNLDMAKLQVLLDREMHVASFDATEIRYDEAGTRMVRMPEEIALETSEPASLHAYLKPDGVYWITGGLGGLGRLFTRHLAEQRGDITIILSGRSPLDDVREQQLQTLRESGATVVYLQADVSVRADVDRVIQHIKAAYGQLNGIIHSAGVLHDSFIRNKTTDAIAAVLAPKAHGAYNIDLVTQEEPLDFLVLFSSLAGLLGNVGQADYAAANAFLDAFANHRQTRVECGERSGHTISINWPLWAEGGMSIDDEGIAWLEQEMGLTPLATSAGLAAFATALDHPEISQLIVTSGNHEMINTHLMGAEQYHSASLLHGEQSSALLTDRTSDTLRQRAERYLQETLSSTLKLPVARIKATTAWEVYGVDSILVLTLTRQLEQHFGQLPKTLFFEYQTLAELADYFVESYPDHLLQMIDQATEESISTTPAPTTPFGATSNSARKHRLQRTVSIRPGQSPDEQRIHRERPEAIAIVGLSGRYPMAETLAEFWENLRAGRDCISEIPLERWDYRRYYAETPDRAGKSDSKWGGFLADVDKFAPLFFNISPHEAERMDPQERLFLEIAWQTLEDAGYTRHDLHQQLQGQVGVFVGVMWGEYQLYSHDHLSLNSSYASIANRVSYLLNLHGPSLAVDTMCSSSLTSIHLACESIRRRECAAALAGGVNLSIHPNKYLYLTEGDFSARDGRCRSFGEGGSGYVPGEGVGAVLLKPLAQAEADGDHIYGVILGSSVNHGGKTNGYTVPNPVAQADLIARALAQSNIDPQSISYIEAHGTGTALGDPIEIRGLSQAVGGDRADGWTCAIGSVKSNIGHLESAAGIAGLTKVLLQMQHGELVPSLHAETLNPHIDFEATPFRVQRELSAWPRPLMTVDGDQHQVPRRAGISSFGAGGANAHVIIEEWRDGGGRRKTEDRRQETGDSHLLVLSARDEERLRTYVDKLLVHWETHPLDSLANVAYTLQIGREAMEARLALVASTVADVQKSLRGFVEGQTAIEGLYRGNTKANNSLVQAEQLIGGEAGAAFIETAMRNRELTRLAALWVSGVEIDWALLYGDHKPQRVSLPTYPFARERYWLPENTQHVTDGHAGTHQAQLHPLVHCNTSTLSEQRYTTTFTGTEFFLRDHQVQGEKMLPGVTYLEMAKAAGRLALDDRDMTITQLRDVVWVRPLTVKNAPMAVNIGLHPLQEGGTSNVGSNAEIAFEVGFVDAQTQEIYCQGKLATGEIESPTPLDLFAIQSRCKSTDDTTSCYQQLAAQGMVYGPAMQGMVSLSYNQEEALAQLQLPVAAGDTKYGLHPSLLDAALQATWGLIHNQAQPDSQHTFLPFAVQTVTIYRHLPEQVYAYVRYGNRSGANSDVITYDIVLTDTTGSICVTLQDLAMRAIAAPAQSTLLYHTPVWEVKPLDDDEDHAEIDNESVATTLLLIGLEQPVVESISATLAQTKVINLDVADAIHIVHQAWDVIKEIVETTSHTVANRILVVAADTVTHSVYAPLVGLLKTLRLEQPRCLGKVLTVTPSDVTNLLSLIHRELRPNSFAQTEVQIDGMGTRTVKTIREVTGNDHEQIPYLRPDGVYWITGGLGGLGRVVARHLLTQSDNITVVLSGRSPLDEADETVMLQLQEAGGTVVYLPADVSLMANVEQVIQTIKKRYGRLNGVIHSAGVLRDSLIHNKSVADLDAVLAPKMMGAINIDAVTQAEELDFMVFFSSLTAVLGNVGQADYAAANAFLDAFAHERQALVEAGKRTGQTVSINWPLWAAGGMAVDAETTTWLQQEIGLTTLETAAGLNAFDRCLSQQGLSQLLITSGDQQKIRAYLTGAGREQNENQSVTEKSEAPELSASEESHLFSVAERYLKEHLSAILKLSQSRIDATSSWDQYGLDSVLMLRLIRQWEATFGELPKTLLFEYPTLTALTTYFVKTHPDELRKLVSEGIDNPASTLDAAVATTDSELADSQLAQGGRHLGSAGHLWASSSVQTTNTDNRPMSPRKRWLHHVAPIQNAQRNRSNLAVNKLEAIAIVGLSGRYPMAENLTEFWANLQAGRDCISPLPTTRRQDWPWDDANDMLWGGFLADVDQFDPLFFNISPREAIGMDPQERLFLEIAWQTLEDAGYTRQSIHEQWQGRVGVFVGVMWGEYQLYGEETLRLNSSYASIANRVSHALDLHGPSLAVDTMCSSSLTSIHLACESIRRGECVAALAGGVNLSLHPNKYQLLSQSNFTASDGRCRSFGEGGDGYVPGEGVGAVLLKPLSQAEADGDQIYGVIKSSSVNHGGKSSGYSVPNPVAQGQLIAAVLQKGDISPESISYVEAHGTGTALGDPIELRGLSQGFGDEQSDQYTCAIGSVKSNIGHLEAAAGIAGLTKVLLQMKHRQLAPSIHTETLNPHIDFAATPFRVQRQLAAWEQPIVTVDGVQREVPRRAGISSFGAGGANAHVIVEEYTLTSSATEIRGNGEKPKTADDQPQLILLSAKNWEQLRTYAQHLLAFLAEPNYTSVDEQIPSTMQQTLCGMVAALVDVAVTDIEPYQSLEGYGIDTVQLSELQTRVEEAYQCEFSSELFVPQNSVALLAEALTAMVANDEPYVMANTHRTPALADFAYTLQVGREAMASRLAFVCKDLASLRETLTAYLTSENDGDNVAQLYRGEVKPGKTGLFTQDEDLQTTVTQWIRKGKLEKLAQVWIEGGRIDWTHLPRPVLPRRTSLPTYPFERNRYWFDRQAKPQGTDDVRALPTQTPIPLRDGKLVLASTQQVAIPPLDVVPTNGRSPSTPSAITTETALEQSTPVERDSLTNAGTTIREQVHALLLTTLYLDKAVDEERPFSELGMDSITGVEFIKHLNQTFALNLKIAKLYEYPAVRELAAHITSLVEQSRERTNGHGTTDIVRSPTNGAVDSINEEELILLMQQLAAQEATVEEIDLLLQETF